MMNSMLKMMIVTRSIQKIAFFVAEFGSRVGASRAKRAAETKIQNTMKASYFG
jgi:hypothetical protein